MPAHWYMSTKPFHRILDCLASCFIFVLLCSFCVQQMLSGWENCSIVMNTCFDASAKLGEDCKRIVSSISKYYKWKHSLIRWLRVSMFSVYMSWWNWISQAYDWTRFSIECRLHPQCISYRLLWNRFQQALGWRASPHLLGELYTTHWVYIATHIATARERQFAPLMRLHLYCWAFGTRKNMYTKQLQLHSHAP